jgi:hypothetical protein
MLSNTWCIIVSSCKCTVVGTELLHKVDQEAASISSVV